MVQPVGVKNVRAVLGGRGSVTQDTVSTVRVHGSTCGVLWFDGGVGFWRGIFAE